jgi:tRNA (cmo5U34)-methyltransferase
MSQFHFDPATYDALMAEEVPAYSRLQEAVATAAAGCAHAAHILDLGTGTGVTASRVLEVHPHAKLVGVDGSADMLTAAVRILPDDADLRVARLQDPLPPGPFDLVVTALAVHHLDGYEKADLFRRVAHVLRPGGRFVLGDLIIPDDLDDVVTPIDGSYDRPSTLKDQLAWLQGAGFSGATAWLERDLAVLVGDLQDSGQ